jgi:hypothetical protein
MGLHLCKETIRQGQACKIVMWITEEVLEGEASDPWPLVPEVKEWADVELCIGTAVSRA